jgi:hypothetical protein
VEDTLVSVGYELGSGCGGEQIYHEFIQVKNFNKGCDFHYRYCVDKKL